MIQACIKDAICALLAVDKTATDDDRRMVTDALAGRKISRPYTYSEVSELLGCHRNSVARLVERGILKTVPGPGGRLRVLAWSLEDYMNGRNQ